MSCLSKNGIVNRRNTSLVFFPKLIIYLVSRMVEEAWRLQWHGWGLSKRLRDEFADFNEFAEVSLGGLEEIHRNGHGWFATAALRGSCRSNIRHGMTHVISAAMLKSNHHTEFT
jgi:hypothetical protein